MKPIFNRLGHPIAWLDGTTVFDSMAVARAFIARSSVFSFSATHLGFFTDGFFRDSDGAGVAFTEGATNGPKLPPLTRSLNRPNLVSPSGRPRPDLPPPPPLPMRVWSIKDWPAFLAG